MINLFKNFKIKDFAIIISSVILIFIQVWLDLKIPDYMSKITLLVQSNSGNLNEILITGLYMILCALISLTLAFIVGYFASYLASIFSFRIRKKLYNKVLSFSLGDIKLFSTNSLITRTTNDISQIEILIAIGLQMIVKAPIMAVFAIFKIINKNFEWVILTASAVLILLTIITILMIIVVPKFKIVQQLTDMLNGKIRENLSGIRVIRAFNAEKFQEDKFEEVNAKLTNQQLSNQKKFAILSPVMYLIMYSLTLLIYYIGAHLIDGSIISEKIIVFSDMIVFSSYAMQIIMSFLMLAMIFMLIPRASISAKRINEVLDCECSIKDGNKLIKLDQNIETIEFNDVSFKYPDAEDYILKNISFKANKGETIAFIGSTGSGKSTLVNLILRFYDVTNGDILINNVSIKDYNLNSLYKKIGYVPQKAVIFNDEIKNNINYGDNNLDINNIKDASKIAQAYDFIENMDAKFNTHLATSGTNISGGQKQRIAIARCIARKPEIYVFDDSFSALDYKTDSLLRNELKKIAKNSITFIVAQRIGTIMNADKIIVLDEGCCVGIGSHKELLNNCDIYKQIALSQLKEEELQ